jgi:hypothetical protein
MVFSAVQSSRATETRTRPPRRSRRSDESRSGGYNAAITRLAAFAVAAVLTAPAASADARTSALVGYSRTGGIAGLRDTLTVLRDGSVLSSRGNFRLTPRRLKQLVATLDGARFATLQRRYSPDYPVADGFTFRVTYRGRPVVVEQEARVPLRLQRALDALADLFVRRA